MRLILVFILAIISFQNTAIARGKMTYDINEVKRLLDDLFELSDRLSNLTDRHFTPDGHVVGSAGEVFAAYHFGLKLVTASTKGFDALTKQDVKVEIKATGGKRGVAFNWTSDPIAERVLVLRLDRELLDGFEIVYNGSAKAVWEFIQEKKKQKTGQRQITLNKLRTLSKRQVMAERIVRIR